jgi:Ca-activated chloride channel homolog
MIEKGFLLTILLLIGPGDISKINTVKSEARKAYLAGDYKTAAAKYTYLVDSAGVREDEVMMNLANAAFHLNDTTRALGSYQSLTLSQNPRLKSIANQQLGVMVNRNGKMEEALNYFKQAIKADPANDDARFNYELVKKKLDEKKKKEEQQKQDKNQQNKDQENKDKESKEQENKDKQDQKNKDDKKEKESKEQEEKEKKEQEGKEKEQKEKEQKDKQNQEKKDIPPSVKEKLKDMDMSEEKARMILEAMKNQEIQYLQQNKRKPTKQRDKTKPDW